MTIEYANSGAATPLILSQPPVAGYVCAQWQTNPDGSVVCLKWEQNPSESLPVSGTLSGYPAGSVPPPPAPPVALFTARLLAGGKVQFTLQTVGATTYHYNFGDGRTSDEPNPLHVFPSAGSYAVELSVGNNFNQFSVYVLTITVTMLPAYIDFSYGANGLTVYFQNISTIPGDLLFDFGDGTADAIATDQAFHKYASNGTYTVIAYLNSDKTKYVSHSITVTQATGTGDIPVIQDSFTGPDTTDITTHTPELGGTWGVVTGSGAQILGNQLRGLAESTEFFISNSASGVLKYAQIKLNLNGGSYGPTFYGANFAIQLNASVSPDQLYVDAGGNISLNGTVVDTSGYVDGAIYRIEQDGSNIQAFINGALIGTQAKRGIGSVARIDGEDGTPGIPAGFTDYEAGSIGTVPIATPDAPLQAKFLATPTTGEAPLTVSCTDISNGSPTSWSWIFAALSGQGYDLDVFATSTEQNPSYTFEKPGLYWIYLIVSNAQGARSTYSVPITVTALNTVPNNLPVVPIASGTLSAQLVNTGTSITFTSTSTGDIASCLWDFGDTNTSSSCTDTHAYSANGVYTVTLTVTDAFGVTSSCTFTVVVSADLTPENNPPIAIISVNPNVGMSPLDAQFTSSVNTTCTYEWDFGDGQTDAPEYDFANPHHVYYEAKRYIATLKVINIFGYTKTSIEIVVVERYIQGGNNGFGLTIGSGYMGGFRGGGGGGTPSIGEPCWYILDKPNDKVLMYDYTGTYLGSFGSTGTGPGELTDPSTLTVIPRPI